MLKKLKELWKANKADVLKFAWNLLVALGVLGTGAAGGIAANEYNQPEQPIIVGATPEQPHKVWTVEISVDVRRTTIETPALSSRDYYDRQSFYFEIEGDRYPGEKKALQAWETDHEYEMKTGVIKSPRVEKIYPFVNYEKDTE